MKRNTGKSVSLIIAAAFFALVAGCASVPSANTEAPQPGFANLDGIYHGP